MHCVYNALQAPRQSGAWGTGQGLPHAPHVLALVIHPSPLYERAKAPRLARVETTRCASIGWNAYRCQVLSRLLLTRSCSGSGPLHSGLPPGPHAAKSVCLLRAGRPRLFLFPTLCYTRATVLYPGRLLPPCDGPKARTWSSSTTMRRAEGESHD